MKNTIIAIIVVAVIALGAYFIIRKPTTVLETTKETDSQNNEQATTTSDVEQTEGSEIVIGKSVEGRDIVAYNYLSAKTGGEVEKRVLFVGGVHGGYSWNTALVAYELMDYLKANPNAIPNNVKVTVIPVLNPDGLNKVTGTSGLFSKVNVSSSETVQISGRYNASKVDLNRNFDCNWKSVGTWRTTAVSGGSSVFSEPESQAFRSYVETHKPNAVVVWYSAAGGVYASSCDGSILPETSTMTNIYAKASGYPAYQSFDFYETTGDLVNWLAKNKIPGISVLLSNHTDTEWTKNQAGIKAILEYYAK